jgi:hypothetical protein
MVLLRQNIFTAGAPMRRRRYLQHAIERDSYRQSPITTSTCLPRHRERPRRRGLGYGTLMGSFATLNEF